MNIPRPSYDEILNRIYNDVITQTPLRADLDQSALGVILKSVAAELDQIWAVQEDIAKQSSLFTATGLGLDKLGENVGVTRKLATKASSLGFTRPVRFTNLSGSSITIPAGTRVWDSRDPQTAFFTLEGLTLNAGVNGEVHVQAAEVGDIYNVPRGAIDSSSFVGASVSVTNILPIQEGSYRESDESYRSRLIAEYQRRVVFNATTAREMLRGVPNVRDVLIIDQPNGPGTFDAIIVPYIETQINSTVQTAQTLLDTYTPVGVVGVAKAPIFRHLDMSISITFQPAATNRQVVRDEIKAQIMAIIDALPVEDGNGSGTLSLPQFLGIALNSDQEIADVNVEVGLDGTKLNPRGEVRPAIGEKIILRSIIVQ